MYTKADRRRHPRHRSTNSSSNTPVTPPTSQETRSTVHPSDPARKSGRELTRINNIRRSYWGLLGNLAHDAHAKQSISSILGTSELSQPDSLSTPYSILLRDTLVNRDGIPEGVHPPCRLDPRWVTVDREYHPKRATLIRPKNLVSCQAGEDLDGLRFVG
ncbi:hypothetical protein L218DRAFT_69153 [Marasmius fiardii PR-910]|nr:hypothetical protein L218DRAFT_69153 [Marasmius fiardii PR-910]